MTIQEMVNLTHGGAHGLRISDLAHDTPGRDVFSHAEVQLFRVPLSDEGQALPIERRAVTVDETRSLLDAHAADTRDRKLVIAQILKDRRPGYQVVLLLPRTSDGGLRGERLAVVLRNGNRTELAELVESTWAEILLQLGASLGDSALEPTEDDVL